MSISGNERVAIVTGASSGIGQATALALAEAGFRVVIGARRQERLNDVAEQIAERSGQRPFAAELDVTSLSSAEQFVEKVLNKYGQIHVLVNNAGLARGTAHVAEATSETDWQEMVDTNVMGLVRMTRLCLPHILASGNGHIVNLGSAAGHEAYAGGSVYCGTKFAERAITQALRQELLGKPVRVTSVDPGMVETEFSIVRFHGDKSQADQVYQGMQPLRAEDIADCILFAVTRPLHVNLDEILIKSIDQAGPGKVARRQTT